MKDKLFIGWIFSGIMFLLSSIPFFIGFFFDNSWKISFFAICLIGMVLFGVIYLKLDKQMKERTNCSKFECVYFYKKCKAAGVAGKIQEKDKEIIKTCAKELTYFANIDAHVLYEIYSKGMKAYKSKNR